MPLKFILTCHLALSLAFGRAHGLGSQRTKKLFFLSLQLFQLIQYLIQFIIFNPG